MPLSWQIWVSGNSPRCRCSCAQRFPQIFSIPKQCWQPFCCLIKETGHETRGNFPASSVKDACSKGLSAVLTTVCLYSNNCSPILKQPFAYTEIQKLSRTRGRLGVQFGHKRANGCIDPVAPGHLFFCLCKDKKKDGNKRRMIHFSIDMQRISLHIALFLFNFALMKQKCMIWKGYWL